MATSLPYKDYSPESSLGQPPRAYKPDHVAYQWGNRRVHDTLPLNPLTYTRTIRVERRELVGMPALALSDNYWRAVYAEAWLYLPLIKR